jgi:predicted metal-binding membrane protein
MRQMANEPLGTQILPCCGVHFGVTLTMWIVMMAAMMLPSVAPMVLTHAAIVRRDVATRLPFVPTGLFLSGYLVAWSAFSALAALTQSALYRGGWLDGRSLSVAPIAGAVVLVAAGAFQLSSAKRACLSHCRAPLAYFMTEWRDGRIGAVSMGFQHGLFCIGCCWPLMAILFAVGVMNIAWSVLLTAFVVAEKLVPWPRLIVWSGALACFGGGAALLYRVALGS